jgi:hypothetical protein
MDDDHELKIKNAIQVNRDWDDENFIRKKDVKYTKSIGEAIVSAQPGTIIQIAAGNYSESLTVKTPNLILESLEEDGKVVLLSSKRPCITIELNEEDTLEINRIRMIYKGPNSQNKFTQKIDMNYEMIGNGRCMSEYNLKTVKKRPDGLTIETPNLFLPCVILQLSGSLTLQRCVLSLNGVSSHMTEKIPCLAAHERTSVFVNNCYLFGDGNDEVFTTGIVANQPLDLIVQDTVIKDHMGGGIMLNLCPYTDSKFQILNNKLFKCKTAGIYIEGEGTYPQIIGNEIKNCNAVGKLTLP